MQTRNGQLRPPVERRQTHDDDSAFGRVPAFLAKTFDLVGDRDNSDIVSWEDNGQSFIIWQPAEFSRDLLPQYFKHSNLASFVRQLNTYGFQKASPDRWEFHHPNFKRAHPEQLTNIPRRRTAHKPNHAVSEGFIDNGLVAQVHALKQDKRMIMLELLKLQQTQERAQKEAEQLNGRLLRTEQNQKQLMSCLAAAVQDPGILRNMLAATSERGALTDSPGIAGKKRARSWQDNSTDSESNIAENDEPAGQLVTRATADALWPKAARQRSASLTPQVPVLGSLPAEAVKAPVNPSDGSDRFSFMPVSDGLAKAVSPFAVSQGQADAATVLEVNQAVADQSSGGKAPASGATPLSLQSTDLILPKTSAAVIEDGNWPVNNSLNPISSEWARAFDMIGSQPSWTFAVGQGMEAVH